MRFAIAYSKIDPAGMNIIGRLKEISFSPQIPIIELKKQSIYSDDLIEKNYPELRNIDFIVFATTHRSIKGEASLSVHAPGNWRDSDLGGKPGKVCKTSAFVLKFLFQGLNKNLENSPLKGRYKATMEVTHHGPLIELPCCFIEIGSSEEQWKDKEAGKLIAKTILSLQNFNEKNFREWIPAIGIGGPHYSPNFNKVQLNSGYAISHIIPEYSLSLTESMLKEAEEKTIEQVKEILIDWKGCGKSEQRQEVIGIIEKTGLKYKRTSQIKNGESKHS